jgi:hypothetical protein
LGACSVCGVSITAAACERFDDEGATPDVRVLVAAVSLPLDVGGSLSAELGGTKAADGATALADTVAESLWVAVALTVAGPRLAGLCAGEVAGAAVDDAGAAVDDVAAGSLVDGATTRGAGGSALVAG